ncbi:MAG: hypothetical protein ACKVZJ_10865 [Phycisphaerales bacterium]
MSPEVMFSLLIVVLGVAVGWGIMRATLKSLADQVQDHKEKLERIATVKDRVEKLEDRHDTHVQKLDTLCNDVSALVARIDMLFSLGRHDAMLRRAGQ